MSDTKTGDYRLRQIAFVAGDAEGTAKIFHDLFGVEVAFRDPGVAHYGLKNVVIPFGDDFLEVVEPTTDQASAWRYHKRRGGDSGYMVILQAADAVAHRQRLADAGVQIVEVMDTKHHVCSHFHPREFEGVLASMNSVPGVDNWRDLDTDWFPAGRDWRKVQASDALGIASVTIESKDPRATAELWSKHLAVPVQADGNGYKLELRGAAIRFAKLSDERGTGIAGVAIKVRDPKAVLDRARKADVPVNDGSVIVSGTRITPVAA